MPGMILPRADGGSRHNLVARAAPEPLNGLDGGTYLAARLRARGTGYLVRRVLIQGPEASLFRIYTGEPSAESLADGSQSGALDVADFAQPLYVDPGLELVGVWTPEDLAQPLVGDALMRVELEDV